MAPMAGRILYLVGGAPRLGMSSLGHGKLVSVSSQGVFTWERHPPLLPEGTRGIPIG
jgi:hypothetical protein